MRWPTANRSLIVSLALIGCGLAVCAWQMEEHLGFERAAKAALIERGRDITSTLGVVLRSQRRYGLLVEKERIEPSLQALVQSEKLVSIAILAVTGEPLAIAGRPMDLTPEEMQAGGVYWGDRTLTIMNLIDLGGSGAEDGTAATIVMTDQERRSLRSAPSRRQPDASTANAGKPAGPAKNSTTTARATARPPFGRPAWMTEEQYDAVIQAKGVHSLVISLSTDEMHRQVGTDLLLRLLVGLLAMGGAIISTLAWHNVEKNVELQIRLVKAREMNTHLKDLNLAATGLAQETRQPLDLIRGLAQRITMQEQGAPPLKAHATAIVEEVDRIAAQLNELIDYSKPREARLAPVEIRRLVADVARPLLPDIEKKQIRLLQPETSCVIEADEPLLRRALFNVLLNALQAVGPNGQIKIRVSQVNAREAVLEISDDGPGVPPAERDNIFKPYMTMRAKGAGLGLAIVQQIAAAHRWEVVCVANEPRGALIRFNRLKVVAPHG